MACLIAERTAFALCWKRRTCSFKEAREAGSLSFLHFLSAFLHCLLKVFRSSSSHGERRGFSLLVLTGAMESKMIVHELLKMWTRSLTLDSFFPGDVIWQNTFLKKLEDMV